MISANKFFIVIVSIILFIILISSSYFTKDYSTFQKPYYENNQNGLFKLNLDNEKFLDEYNGEKEGININFINSFDKILTHNSEFEYFEENNLKNINLGDGIYLINISELNGDYVINGEGFRIKNNGPLSVYIDTTNRRKLIFSINTILDLEIIDTNNSEVINNIYLYPHKYIRLFPERNPQIRNADLLRVSLSTGLDYFNDKIIKNGEINNEFNEKIILRSEDENKEIGKMFLYLYKSNLRERNILDGLKIDKFGNIVGENLIKRYNDLFLNRDKKIIYYKNTILRGLGDLVKSEEIEESKTNFLIKSLNDLKNIDENGYNEMRLIIEYYSSIIINGNKKDINSKINFSKIYNNLKGKDYKFNNENNLILNDIFFNFDFLEEDNLYTKLKIFNENNVKSDISEGEKSYFMFFLNKIIIYGFNEIKDNNQIIISDIIKIFDTYTNLSIDFYSKNEEVIIRTGLNEYSEIIEIILNKIKELYFTRNENTLLLERKDNFNVKREDIEILEKNINRILEYYNNNKNNIPNTQSNLLTKLSLEESIRNFEEYFLALKDESIYIATYNDKIKDIIFGGQNTINNEGLSIENALNYLRQFNYIDLNSVEIKIKNYNYCLNPTIENDSQIIDDPFCYKINNLIIGNGAKIINFLLHPYSFNNISNFEITLSNGQKEINNGSYRLDNIKVELEELYKRAISEEDRNKYLFSNFFLNYFVTNQGQISNINEINDTNNNLINIENETEIIRFFKRNRLLGEEGTLTKIRSIISINYNSIIVKEINNGFDINIDKGNLTFQKNNINYIGEFSSKYMFSPDNSFINPNILLKDNRGNILLNGNKLNIIGEIKLDNLKNDFDILFDEINNINQILLAISNNLLIFDFKVDYINENSNFIIYNNKYKITIKDKNVISITIDGRNVIDAPINTSRINDILKLIN